MRDDIGGSRNSYNNILLRLEEYGVGGNYLLKSFVMKLLQAEAALKSQTIEVVSSHHPDIGYDALAREGLGDLNGPLAITIAVTLDHQRISTEFFKLKYFSKAEVISALYISLREPDAEIIKYSSLYQKNREKLHFWGPREIQSLIAQHPEVATEASSNLFSNRMRTVLEHSKEDWKDERTLVIDKIRASYSSGRFSLLLGAGVSSSAGMPDWDTLLNSLFVSMLTTEDLGGKNAKSDTAPEHIASIVKRLRELDGPSALTLARYIRKGIVTDSSEAQDEFIATVTHQLYALRNKELPENSALIKAVVDLCVPSRTGANVKAVLTYNFDDLIEKELTSRGLAHRPIFEEIQLPTARELPVYHVHGFLPEERSKFTNINKSTLVFSEEGYHQIYRDAYHWSNLVQLNSLKETSCLMVGLSLTDPNLRRLLEISAKSMDAPRHFAFMKRIPYEKFSKVSEKSMLRASAPTVKRFLERHHKLNEEVMKELGVTVIWYEDYKEIPTILKSLNAEAKP
ncbi:SIR2 family protein [Alcaligenes nematophilus]|uniref:SIR2 family protein n=1 Tax=Alcaligenes nematophilus TaxID=2994643 RepID=UPI00384E7324